MTRLIKTAICLSMLSYAAAACADPNPQGEKVFQKWCSGCHAANDQSPGTLALQAKYKGSLPAALEQRDDLAPAMVSYFVRHGVSVMPFFRKVEISDEELKALTQYLQKSPDKKP